MQDPSYSARTARPQSRSSLGLTPVPLERQTSRDQARPHHPLVSSRRAELSGALREEIHELRNRSYDAKVAKSAILANLNHEFRTPLNAIIGFSELMMSESAAKIKNEQHREYIGDIHRSAFRLLDMVNALLDTANVTNGLADLDRQDADLVEIISEARDVLKPTAQARGINLEIDADCTNCNLLIDADRFSQAVRQIFSEAIRQANPDETILISVNCSVDAVSISFSCLSYQQLSTPVPRYSANAHFVSRSSDDAGGSVIDLDLSVAKTIIELHGGYLDLISDGTVGLQAKLHLPRQNGQAATNV
ncbi:MAG: two-component system cell cycle sensor histidine kinase PleC [Paracoccaceae bacterium]|jgi:two-component system cell cycle sensor histidine kinase PleC